MKTFVEYIDNTLELKAQGPDVAALNDARGISGDIEVLCSIDKCTGEVFVDKSLLGIKGISQAIKKFTDINMLYWYQRYPEIHKGKRGIDGFGSFYF